MEFEIKIRGLRPYLQNRLPKNREEIEETKRITKILQKDPLDDEAINKAVELAIYKDENGKPYIPAIHLEQAIVNAAKQIRMKGAGRKTYKDFAKANIYVVPEKIEIQGDGYEIDSQYVVIPRNRARVLRYRPRWDNWEATFKLIVLDDTVPSDIIRQILEIAGTRVGIGDYRPRYGLFEIVEFKKVK